MKSSCSRGEKRKRAIPGKGKGMRWSPLLPGLPSAFLRRTACRFSFLNRKDELRPWSMRAGGERPRRSPEKSSKKWRKSLPAPQEKIQAALGPCIGPCCYEVDGPVEEKFRDGGLPWEAFASLRGPGKWSLDLQEANTHLLIKSGVKKENIRRLAYCTACRSDSVFFLPAGERDPGKAFEFYIYALNLKQLGNLRWKRSGRPGDSRMKSSFLEIGYPQPVPKRLK